MRIAVTRTNDPVLLPERQPLTTIPAGALVQVVKITGGVKMLHTLAQSHILRGVTLSVVRNDWGPLLVAVEEKRLALDRDLAYHVQVSPLDPTRHTAR